MFYYKFETHKDGKRVSTLLLSCRRSKTQCYFYLLSQHSNCQVFYKGKEYRGRGHLGAVEREKQLLFNLLHILDLRKKIAQSPQTLAEMKRLLRQANQVGVNDFSEVEERYQNAKRRLLGWRQKCQGLENTLDLEGWKWRVGGWSTELQNYHYSSSRVWPLPHLEDHLKGTVDEKLLDPTYIGG